MSVNSMPEGKPYKIHGEDWSVDSALEEFKNIVECSAFTENGVFIEYFGENNG